MRTNLTGILSLVLAAGLAGSTLADDVSKPISDRFQAADVQEVPNFQKHVVPLFGRLGCNGRACHGSFQGRGGFRLSLFGYDFKADHEALFDKESPRVDVAKPLESLIIAKPTDADMHEGGKRYDKDSWQYHVIRKWIEGGAKWEDKDLQKLASLQVIPAEIEFSKTGETVQMKAIAVWADGTKEDVTPLCRFQSNDEQVAKIEPNGLVTATDKGDTHIVVFYDKAVIPVPVIRPVTDLVGAKYPKASTPTKIDELVVAKLSKLGIVQSDVCTDGEFLRRVSLDLTGTLPTADEVRAFINDTSADKRKKKVDELLETPAYAAWWTTKLCDFTTNNDQTLNNVGIGRGTVTQDWWDWIHKRVKDNTPYDQLAAGIVLGKSRNEGESYLEYCEALGKIARREDGHSFAERETMPYYWARQNLQNKPEEKAISFAYSFMAVRIECAQCHKHPFDQWSKDDFDQFKKFFASVAYNQNGIRGGDSEDRKTYDKLVADLDLNNSKFRNNNEKRNYLADAVKEGKTVPYPEVAVNSPRPEPARKGKGKGAKTPAAAQSNKARMLGGDEFDLASLKDSREPLMNWLRDKGSSYFATAFANRVWANYFNVGIVSPTDDLNLANAPSNKPLLDYLKQGFIDSGYNMKWLHREITNSRTYQLSWHTNDTNKLDERNFSRAVPRRLPAEVAYDAIYSATVADARANTMRTDFKGRAIAIPGASTPRNNINNGSIFALSVFGRSTRETNCDCDRSMDASLLQTVYLQNDVETKTRIEARDSWVTQVTVKTAKEKPGKEGDELAAQIKTLERRLERAKKQKNEEQIKKAEQQLADLQKQVAPQTDAPEKVEPEAVKPLVETAYLRSLSRFPTSEEMATATQYVVDEGSLTGGLQDLMWALVNTKEFIVNH
jgi:hypothetical protein